MSKIKFITIIILMFTILPFVSGDYNFNGDNNFNLDDGLINSVNSANIGLTGVRGMTSPRFEPYFVNLTNNSCIAVVDGVEIKFFKDKTLTPFKIISLSSSTISNPVFIDFNENGFTDVMVTDVTNKRLLGFEFNGSDFNIIVNVSIQATLLGSQCYTGCQTGKCGVLCAKTIALNTNNARILNLDVVNSTSSNNMILIAGSDGAFEPVTQRGYLPKVPTLIFESNQIYVSGRAIYGSGPTDKSFVFHVSTTEDLVLNAVSNYSITGAFDISGIVLENFDGFVETLKELSFGYQDSADSYQLNFLDDDLSLYKTIGNIDSGEGELLTNPFTIEFFPSSNGLDICVGGYDNTDSQLTFLCGMWDNTYSGKELFLDNYLFNTSSSLLYNSVIHTSNQVNSISGDEIISSMGVITSTYDCDLFNNCDIILNYATNFNNAVVSTFDLENNGNSDLVVLTESNLYYYDDGFSNTPAELDSITFNPCIDAPIKVNESLFAYLTIYDDFDLVSSRVYAYYGTPYEQLSNWTSYLSTSSIQQHSLILNQTGNNYIIRVEVRDQENPDNIDINTYTFSVGNQGVEFGDCTSTFNEITTIENETATATDSTDQNAIESGVNTLSKATRLSSSVLVLLFLGIVIYMIWKSPTTEKSPQFSFGVIVILSAFTLIIGVKTGLVSFEILLTLIILICLPIGIWIGKRLLGHGRGSE